MSDMTPRERVEEQTRIRRALLANGYTPLANRDKMCVLRGWPGIAVDDGVIDDWSDQLRYPATGVRVDGRLVVLDFDIDDADMLDAVFARLDKGLKGVLKAAPQRYGRGEKIAMFLRLAEGEQIFGRIVSQGYAPPGSGDDAVVMRVEAFGSKAARQFGAYGPHSHAEDGSVAVAYEWADDRGLADVRLDDLPEITVEQVKMLCDAASTTLREAGWEYEVRTHAGAVDDRPVYDLDETMEFVTAAYGVMGLDDLEALCDAAPEGVRLSASWLEGPTARNMSRCIARLHPGDGRLQIWESASCVVHRPRALDVKGKVATLGDRLRGRVDAAAGAVAEGTEDAKESSDGTGLTLLDRLLAAVPEDKRLFGGNADEGGDTTPEQEARDSGATAFDAALEALLEGWAWVTIGSGFAAPVGGSADQMMTVSGLKNTMAPWCKVEQTKRKTVETNPADIWLKHPQRIMAGGHKLIPWTEEKIATDESGQTWLNTYQPPRHGGAVQDEVAAARAVAAWVRFLEHLVPDPREREWFEMWLAAKVQKPWLPNCGVVMVAETHGTGRGTLFDMLGAIMGERHVKPVSSTELMGGSGQGQYTDWLADALVVTCDELLAGNDAGGAMEWKRREVYERLKTYVDPRARRVRIVRKGLPGYETEVYASFLMATNNPNALPLAEQDRRFAVVRNTSVKLVDAAGGAVHEAVTEWRGEDSRFTETFGAAVWRRLSGVAVDFACLRDAPEWMEGRADMLAANEGDLEEIVSNVLGDVPGDFLLGEHLRARLRIAREAGGMEHEMKNWWVRAQDMLARRNGSGGRRMARRQDVQPRAAGRKFVSVYYRVDGAGEAAWEAASLDERAVLWRRGGDLNDKLSRIETKVRERGLKVLDGKDGGPA